MLIELPLLHWLFVCRELHSAMFFPYQSVVVNTTGIFSVGMKFLRFVGSFKIVRAVRM